MNLFFQSMFLVVFILVVCTVDAQTTDQCGSVLIPSEERIKNDYSLFQSYIFMNAEYEYEKLKSMNEKQKNASAIYKDFKGAFDSAENAADFKAQVRSELKSLDYQLSAEEARSEYRRGLTEEQIDAWKNCIISLGGGLLLSYDQKSKDNVFTMTVYVVHPPGIGSGNVELAAENGKIDGKDSLEEKFVGSSSKTFFVKPDKRQGISSVLIKGNMPGYTDSLTIPLRSNKKRASYPKYIGTPFYEVINEKVCSKNDLTFSWLTANEPQKFGNSKKALVYTPELPTHQSDIRVFFDRKENESDARQQLTPGWVYQYSGEFYLSFTQARNHHQNAPVCYRYIP